MADQKPTCKAVKRPGQRGARIHPKGCKIRSTVQGDGTIQRTNKRGQPKQKVKATTRNFKVTVSRNNHSKQFIWDTGAMTTSINYKLAKRWKLLSARNQPAGPHERIQLINADKSITNGYLFPNVQMRVRVQGKTYTVTAPVAVKPRALYLLGVSTINKLTQVNVKFR